MPEHIQPFVRCIPASQMIFGYCNGNGFEEQFNSSEAYQDAWQRFQKRVERESESANKTDPCIVLARNSLDS